MSLNEILVNTQRNWMDPRFYCVLQDNQSLVVRSAASYATGTTIAAADLVAGLIKVNTSGASQTLTLPGSTGIYNAMAAAWANNTSSTVSLPLNTSFNCKVVNASNGAGTSTVTLAAADSSQSIVGPTPMTLVTGAVANLLVVMSATGTYGVTVYA